MTATLLWAGTVTAASSISHGGETRGTISLLRRELIAQPGGDPAHVPVISGNAARGILRRLSEELMRDAVGYEHQLPLAAAHVLRGGGELVKTGAEPLSGRRLAELRALLPHLALFGAATGGRIIDGCLQVGKVVPVVTETTHITGQVTTLEAFDATQIETYIRHDDGLHHTTETLRDDLPAAPDRGLDPTVDPAPDPAAEAAAEPAATETSRHLMFRVETFPAGTRLAWWLRLDRASDLQVAYFTDVLDAFATRGHLGGRSAIGHGQVTLQLDRQLLAGTEPHPMSWRDHLADHRDQVLAALAGLT